MDGMVHDAIDGRGLEGGRGERPADEIGERTAKDVKPRRDFVPERLKRARSGSGT
jgi:hypothetical protein